ncbi:MAG: hypothetical protein IKT52_01555 [Oscillospiraceae bacterium]|nr:hypothetical protein [Oscillospiraceae bacterium]
MNAPKHALPNGKAFIFLLVLTRLAVGFGKEGLLPPKGGCTPKIGSPATAKRY